MFSDVLMQREQKGRSVRTLCKCMTVRDEARARQACGATPLSGQGFCFAHKVAWATVTSLELTTTGSRVKQRDHYCALINLYSAYVTSVGIKHMDWFSNKKLSQWCSLELASLPVNFTTNNIKHIKGLDDKDFLRHSMFTESRTSVST